jgi:uncharacterized protein YciI
MKKILFISFILLITELNSLDAVKFPQYWFVFLNSNPDKPSISKEDAEELQKSHLANIDRLYQRRFILAAGPFDGGGGIFIIEADSRQEVIDSISTDPAVKAGRFNLEFIPWEPANGGFCMCEEPSKMVSYYFIRIRYQDSPETVEKFRPDINNAYNEMRDSVKNNFNLLADGEFKDNSGAVLIINSENDDFEDIIEESALLSKYNTQYVIKKLWVAKGIFCEK